MEMTGRPTGTGKESPATDTLGRAALQLLAVVQGPPHIEIRLQNGTVYGKRLNYSNLLTVRMISFHIITAKLSHHPGSVHHQFVPLLVDKSRVRKRRARSTEPMHVVVMMDSRRIHSVDETKHHKQLTLRIPQQISKHR